MTTVRCPICSEQMENQRYDEHMSWRHPETNSEWIRPVAIEQKPVIILDEDDGTEDGN